MHIRDGCRENLLPHLRKAFSCLPEILDIGCGTGVPTIELAKLTNGNITSIDCDASSIAHLREKVKTAGYSSRITVILDSVFKAPLTENHFDVILAEGLFNMTGFKKSLLYFSRFLKIGGYFIIHDEYRDQERKERLMEKHHYSLVKKWLLDEKVWGREYVACLESRIQQYTRQNPDRNTWPRLFREALGEIKLYYKDPSRFRSIYTITRKNPSTD